ncbi:Tetraacyldisaccharide-1-P 4'-kinase [Beggiatoa sp. PS]|nr:Tetraacyldisaccharide-1-P 4'-kinase [Beggiatoa sp. PS]
MKLDDLWYGNHPLSLALIPFSWLFCAIVKIRQKAYQYNLLTSHRVSVPVIIVGNLSVGGTGKTPLVIWLAKFLTQQGFKPGIISRGYGGHAKKWPQPVYPDSDPNLVGDEPILLARHSDCPVVVAPQRILAAQNLLKNHPCNVIISDDGLQHYALHREIEIVVVDENRRYGNQHCLPAGPLREPMSRLLNIDFLVIKKNPKLKLWTPKSKTLALGFSMHYTAQSLKRVDNNTISQPLSKLVGKTVHAIAGIGYPEKFFNELRDNDLTLHCHTFPDHYYYKNSDIQFNDNLPIIMTEKDAVKCQPIASPKHWYLPIEAKIADTFKTELLNKLKEI